jgi:hypothetical protein
LPDGFIEAAIHRRSVAGEPDCRERLARVQLRRILRSDRGSGRLRLERCGNPQERGQQHRVVHEKNLHQMQ